MQNYCLYIKWDYHYDKESTWIDDYSGELRVELEADTAFNLPHMFPEKGEILAVEKKGEDIVASIKIDGHVLTISSSQPPIKEHISDDYCVAGDCVSQDLYMLISIVKK